MGLFGSYENAGVGIAKDAPKKKPFFRYWELVGRKFWKLIEVNMLLMASLIPLIGALFSVFFLINVNTALSLTLAAACILIFILTFGPSIAGCTKIFRNYTLEKPLFIMDTFIKTFRSCFKQSCVMGIIDLLVTASVASGMYVYPKVISQINQGQIEGSATLFYVMFIAGLSIAIAVLLMSFYAYLMIVSTDLSMKNILKNSLALSCIALKKNLLTLLIVVLVCGVFALLTYLFPYIMVFVLPFLPLSFVGFTIVFNCYPVIQKFVINPYYAQRGEVNPEMTYAQTGGENVFEDQGGKEKPVEAPKKPKKKGKVIS